jgi:undecaprenyl-phosphate galactose phosphotransferase/putative colanic acid biosynthesis UDP-glucose lipid carrier transferase
MLDAARVGSNSPSSSAPEVPVWSGWVSSRIKVPYSALQYLLAVFDATLIIFASVVGGGLYQLVANDDLNHVEALLGAGIIAALLYVLIGHSNGFYDLRVAFSKQRKDAGRIFALWSLVSLLLAWLAFLMKSGAVFSRGSIICFGSLALVLLLVCRRFSRRLVASAIADGQVQGRRAILLGTREELASLGVEELLERFGLTEVERVTFSSEKNGGFAMTGDEASSLETALSAASMRSSSLFRGATPASLNWFVTACASRRFPCSCCRIGESAHLRAIPRSGCETRCPSRFSAGRCRVRNKYRSDWWISPARCLA